MTMAETSVEANHGASVPDVSAAPEHALQSSWIQSNNIKVEDRIRLTRLSHMRYQHPDLNAIHRFLLGLSSLSHRWPHEVSPSVS
jgi:hypothetical protein